MLPGVCVTCVANAAPYVGTAVLGLRAMGWRAARVRRQEAQGPPPDGLGTYWLEGSDATGVDASASGDRSQRTTSSISPLSTS